MAAPNKIEIKFKADPNSATDVVRVMRRTLAAELRKLADEVDPEVDDD